MIIAIIFWLLGLVISSFTILPVFIILLFAIPTTIKLERVNLLVTHNSINNKYIRSIIILICIYLISFCFTYFISIHAIQGFIGGTVIALVFSMGKLGKSNLRDYLQTQSKYFNGPPEEIVYYLETGKLLNNKVITGKTPLKELAKKIGEAMVKNLHNVE